MKKIIQLVYSFGMSSLNFLPDNTFGNKIRGNFLNIFLKKKSDNLQVSKNTNLINPWNISIGNDVFIGFGVWINPIKSIFIDDEVIIGPYCCISAGNHTIQKGSYRYGEHDSKEIYIGYGSWLAAHSVITKGSVIPKGTCVASGAIGNNFDKIENEIYVGIPLKRKSENK